jgi:hypothetical protein
MKIPLRSINSTTKLQISTLMAWLFVAPPILASDLQPGEYLNSTNNQSQQPSYQGYTQTQNSTDCVTYAPPAQSNNYQQQSQQAWTPQPPQAIPPSYYGQVQTQQAQGQQNYNSGYQQPITNVNTNSNNQNSQQASTQNNSNNNQTASAVGQVATRVLPMAAAMVGMGIMNKMRTGSMMGYPSYGGYGGYGMNPMMMSGYNRNPYYGGGGYGGYGGYGGAYGMNPMMNMMNPMSRMGMGMGNPMMNMLHF